MGVDGCGCVGWVERSLDAWADVRVWVGGWPWLKTCNVSGYWPLQLKARKLLAQDRHAEKANGLGRQAEARHQPDACLCWQNKKGPGAMAQDM